MVFLHRFAAAVAALPLILAPGSEAAAPWSWPLATRAIERDFVKPRTDYGPGHRGVDIPGQAGEPVHAVSAGTVTFAGQVGGIATITVDHGTERSTYQPVEPDVTVGDAVQRGERIGTLLAGHPSCATTCLNLGRLAGRDYRDPAELLSRQEGFRLISPDGPPPPPPRWEGSGLVNALGGPITSAFGMRRHPITGQRALHDGVDIGAACGTPVPALADGVVTRSGVRGAYGEHVEVQHVGGRHTSYSHLSQRRVRAGDHVEAGQVIGLVGSTGRSTGCHLHLMLLVDGSPVDPLSAQALG